ncbi:MAG: sigma-70 family RNA polymerase sigma factor [Myxococcota bacterium]|nr:sigma-70 family RNA polymerase sigma factor [Myxococcota bacterium]
MSLFMTRKATPEEPDEVLLEAFKKGDRAPFLWLFDRYRDSVIAYVWRMCGRRDVAEDICIEAFAGLVLRVWKPEDSFRESLTSVVHQMCVTHMARIANEPPRSAGFGVPLPGSPEEAVDTSEKKATELAVASVPLGYRAVLLLYYTMELSLDQISRVLACDRDQLPLQLAYARHLFRRGRAL